MDNLALLLKRYGKRGGARYWIGARPDVREGQMIQAILAEIGYPTCADPFDAKSMVALNRKEAALALSYAATVSLAYGWGRRGPSQSNQKAALVAFRDLDDNAHFYSNGFWGQSESGMTWQSLSSATFDAGLLGFDAKHAFVFWVEEED